MRVKKEVNIQLGEEIKAAREHIHFTQEQLAERIDVSPQFVSDLERGVVGISISTLKRVCSVLHVSSDQLLFGQTGDDRTSTLYNVCKDLSETQFEILVEIASKYVEALNL